MSENTTAFGQRVVELDAPTLRRDRHGVAAAQLRLVVEVVAVLDPGVVAPDRLRRDAVAQCAVDVIDELDDDGLRVSDQGDVDGIAAGDAIGHHVDLDQRLAGAEARVPVERGGLVERGTHRQQHVDVVRQQRGAAAAWPAMPITPSDSG
ncbi:MAG: hypothetical protein U0168_16275 [Nannocystaceae bacterium]